MLYGLLITFYIILCTLLMLIIMVQKGKSSMGLGSLGGGAQMLFGGSGGQDIFQKITWVLGVIFMASSLILALMKTREVKKFQYTRPSTSSSAPMSEPMFPMDTENDAESAD